MNIQCRDRDILGPPTWKTGLPLIDDDTIPSCKSSLRVQPDIASVMSSFSLSSPHLATASIRYVRRVDILFYVDPFELSICILQVVGIGKDDIPSPLLWLFFCRVEGLLSSTLVPSLVNSTRTSVAWMTDNTPWTLSSPGLASTSGVPPAGTPVVMIALRSRSPISMCSRYCWWWPKMSRKS